MLRKRKRSYARLGSIEPRREKNAAAAVASLGTVNCTCWADVATFTDTPPLVFILFHLPSSLHLRVASFDCHCLTNRFKEPRALVLEVRNGYSKRGNASWGRAKKIALEVCPFSSCGLSGIVIAVPNALCNEVVRVDVWRGS